MEKIGAARTTEKKFKSELEKKRPDVYQVNVNLYKMLLMILDDRSSLSCGRDFADNNSW